MELPGRLYVNLDPRPAELDPLHSCPVETSDNPLADDVPFELGHGPDDGEHSLADGGGGIELLLEGDEAEIEAAERLQGCDQVLDGPSEAMETPDENRVEVTTPRGAHHPVKCRSALLDAGNAAIDEFLRDLPPALGHVGAEGGQLYLGVLAVGADAGIEGDLHRKKSNPPPSSAAWSYQRSRWRPRGVMRKRSDAIDRTE